MLIKWRLSFSILPYNLYKSVLFFLPHFVFRILFFCHISFCGFVTFRFAVCTCDS